MKNIKTPTERKADHFKYLLEKEMGKLTMKDSAGNDIKAGDVLENSHLNNTRKICMLISTGSRGLFRCMGRDQGSGDRFTLSQKLMDNSKWVKVGA